MVSPGRRPAWAAALTGSWPGTHPISRPVVGSTSHVSFTHSETVATVGGAVSRFSKSLSGAKEKTPHKIAKPSTKCTTEPAAITMVRFHTGNRHIARCSSSGVVSSSWGVIPTILTKPPSGAALIPYWPCPSNDHRWTNPMVPGGLHPERLAVTR